MKRPLVKSNKRKVGGKRKLRRTSLLAWKVNDVSSLTTADMEQFEG